MKSPGLTPAQLEARKRGIGGSDAGAVLGKDPYTSPLKLYRLKVGELESDPPNNMTKRGTYLEPIARKLYRQLTGRVVHKHKQVRHVLYPWMTCNVDGMIWDLARVERDGPKVGAGVLEIKCPALWSFAKAKREGLPVHYMAQMQHNLEVTGSKWGSFALFNADLWELLHFDVERDDEFITMLIEKERTFWLEHVQKRVPPPDAPLTVEEQATLTKLQSLSTGGDLVLRNDPEWAEAARQLTEADDLAQAAEALVVTAQEQVKTLMGGHGVVEGAGLRVHWLMNKGRKSFDREALTVAYPTIDLTRFEKQGQPFERFQTFRVRAGIGD